MNKIIIISALASIGMVSANAREIRCAVDPDAVTVHEIRSVAINFVDHDGLGNAVISRNSSSGTLIDKYPGVMDNGNSFYWYEDERSIVNGREISDSVTLEKNRDKKSGKSTWVLRRTVAEIYNTHCDGEDRAECLSARPTVIEAPIRCTDTHDLIKTVPYVRDPNDAC